MKYVLFCTSYDDLPHGLVFRNNFNEFVNTNDELTTYMNRWKLPNIKCLNVGQYTDILEGTMELPNVKIHVRIMRVE